MSRETEGAGDEIAVQPQPVEGLPPEQVNKLIAALVAVADASAGRDAGVRALLSVHPGLESARMSFDTPFWGLDALMVAAQEERLDAVRVLAPICDAKQKASGQRQSELTALMIGCEARPMFESWTDEEGSLASKIALALIPWSDPEALDAAGMRALDRVLNWSSDALPLIQVLAVATDLERVIPAAKGSAMASATAAGGDARSIVAQALCEQVARRERGELLGCLAPSEPAAPRRM